MNVINGGGLEMERGDGNGVDQIRDTCSMVASVGDGQSGFS